MNNVEFETFKKAILDLVDGINERFEKEQAKTLEKVKELLNERDNRVSNSSYDDGFHKLTHYLQMLIEVAGKTDHRVHAEIEEAVKKLKELTFA